MKKGLLIATCLIVAFVSNAQDNSVLTVGWVNSLNESNFTPIGTDSRCMAYANGKLYFCDRQSWLKTAEKYLHVYDATTGDFIRKVTLPTITDSLGNNTVRTDALGNLLLTNLTTDARSTPFRVWKMANEDDTPTLILDYTASSTGSTGNIRIDFGSIYGNVNGDGYILAPITITGSVDDQDKTILKWTINNGIVSSTPEKIVLKGYVPTSATSNGTFAQTLPIDASSFYFDGSTTYPTLYDMSGSVIDGFTNATGVKTPIAMANGIAKIKLGTNDFLICGANTTTEYTSSPVMHSFYLYKMGVGGTFSGMTLLNTFPELGLGGSNNNPCVVLPIVEKVNETKANIYLYAYLNGIAKYELTINPTAVNEIKNTNNQMVIYNRKISFNETSNVDIYDTFGKRILFKTRVTEINSPQNKGVYIIKTQNQSGKISIKKLIID